MRFNLLSPAKINLVLRIGKLRKDGFHELASLMSKLNWGDRMQGVVRKSEDFWVIFQGSDLGIPVEKNLIYRAANLFHEKFKIAFELEVKLQKNIPTEAGLGGGSSNAATTLLILAKAFGVSRAKLLPLAAKLGSDVHFFLSTDNSAWCLGRGEKLAGVDLPALPILVVKPKKAKISTGLAYCELDRQRGAKARSWFLDLKMPDYFQDSFSIPQLENDFEVLALKASKELQSVKSRLIKSGAVAGQMSGSGSCFFGVYASSVDRERAQGFFKKAGFEIFACEIAA